jgi:hypothetical protein
MGVAAVDHAYQTNVQNAKTEVPGDPQMFFQIEVGRQQTEGTQQS